ncbi:MAG: hypothetical protein WC571_01035 [Candidatus Omnitrophota bacterium]|jgi:uncharacterized protein involved in outer membrane biogenesis
MKKKTRVIILVFVFLFVFCLARDFFIKSLIGSMASRITGTPVSVGGLSLSLIRQSIKISNFKMYNPKGFAKDILVNIPGMSVSWDLAALITGKIHLKELELEIKEIGMVKNKEGKLNVDSLKIAVERTGEKKKKGTTKQLPMQIDIVNLSIGRVISRDYSVEGQPVIKVYDINLKKSYKNITSAQQLAALIITEPLKSAGIEGLKVYGVSMLAGVAALPVMAAFTFTAKDYAQEVFNVEAERAYDTGLEAIQASGRVISENRAGGIISAEVNGARVTLRLKKLSKESTQVNISARKLGFPKPEIASGVMYRLKENLK